MMAYTSWSVVFGEQPSAAKWNILGTNDASFNDGTGLPNGVCLQQVNTITGTAATGTTTIPYDDTIPQNTEGDQYMTLAITPKATTNILVIEALVNLSNSNGTISGIAALFQDSTANALASGIFLMLTASGQIVIPVRHTMAAATVSATTFKIRAGFSGAGTTTFNGAGGTRRFGGATQSSIVIREYKA